MPVHRSFILGYWSQFLQNQFNDIDKVAWIWKKWIINLCKRTYLFPVGSSSKFRLFLLMAPNSSSMGATLYAWGANNMNGTLRSLNTFSVLLDWAYFAPSWINKVVFLQFLSSWSSYLTNYLIYRLMTLESVFTYVRHAYISPKLSNAMMREMRGYTYLIGREWVVSLDAHIRRV